MAHALSQIAVDAPPEVHSALRGLGRTEDVRLSPGGRRLAIACYWNRGISIGDVVLGRTPSGPTASLTRLEQVSSEALREPHGLDWHDDQTLVVANRGGGVAIVRLDGPEPPDVTLLDVSLDAPGSVALRPLGAGRHEVLVCENWRNAVVRLELGEHGELHETGPVQEAWLDLPDGLALSRDGRWLAVSNHNSHSVLVFDRVAGENRDPVAVLRGVDYPHGLRFSADGTLLLVADAGAPHVHVFADSGRGWRGGAYAAAVVAVMDEPTFRRGRHNPQEGGPKGIDVDTGAQVLLATCEELGLAFFDAKELLERPESLGGDADALLRHELDALGAVAREREETARARAETEHVRAELAAVLSTKAWRLTAPVRTVYGGLRRAAGHSRSARRDLATGDVSPREAIDPSR
jgi:sugar lactone lactonase YvrE